jgi:hypothetical protein
MNEIIAKIGPEHSIELIEYRSDKPGPRFYMTPNDGAYLARAMLACAAALHGPTPPPVGTIITDLHLPVAKWSVGPSGHELLLTLTITSGIDLTFQMPLQSASKTSIGR